MAQYCGRSVRERGFLAPSLLLGGTTDDTIRYVIIEPNYLAASSKTGYYLLSGFWQTLQLNGDDMSVVIREYASIIQVGNHILYANPQKTT